MPEVSILVRAKDEASKVLKGIGGSATGLGGAFGNLGILGPLSLGAVGAGMIKLGVDAAALDEVRDSFNALAEDAGRNGPQFLAELQEMSRGMISAGDLMKMVNRSLLLSGEEVADKLPQMLQIAEASADATGQSLESMFTALSEGIGRIQPRQLMQVGIVIKDIDEINKDYAATLGKTAEQLTETEKREALWQETLRKGEELIKRTGGTTDSTADKVERFGATMANLKMTVGEAVIPVLDTLVTKLLEVGEAWDKESRVVEERTETVYASVGTQQEFIDAMYDTLPPLIKEEILLSEDKKAVFDAAYAKAYLAEKSKELIATVEPLVDIFTDLDHEMAINVRTLKDYAFGIQFTTEQMDGLAKMQEKIAAGTFEWVPLRADLTKMWPEAEVSAIQEKIQLLIGQTTDMRIIGAGRALEAERTSYDGELEAANATAEGVKTTWEDAKTRLDETRAGMHGVAGAYDVQAITSEGTALYKLEWEAAQAAVEALEATHIERMGALTAGYAGAVANTTDPALRKWQEYHATVEALNEIKTADAAQKAADAYLPPLEEMLAKLIMEHEIGWGAIEETMRAKVAESIPHVQDLEGAQREVTLRVNETEGGVGDLHDEFVKKMPNIAANVKKGMEDPVEEALDSIKDYRTELDNLDGTRVNVFIHEYYIEHHEGTAGPGGI